MTSFASVYSFKEGLAQVEEGYYGTHGFIDKTRKLAIQPQFDYISDFQEGLTKPER